MKNAGLDGGDLQKVYYICGAIKSFGDENREATG